MINWTMIHFKFIKQYINMNAEIDPLILFFHVNVTRTSWNVNKLSQKFLLRLTKSTEVFHLFYGCFFDHGNRIYYAFLTWLKGVPLGNLSLIMSVSRTRANCINFIFNLIRSNVSMFNKNHLQRAVSDTNE